MPTFTAQVQDQNPLVERLAAMIVQTFRQRQADARQAELDRQAQQDRDRRRAAEDLASAEARRQAANADAELEARVANITPVGQAPTVPIESQPLPTLTEDTGAVSPDEAAFMGGETQVPKRFVTLRKSDGGTIQLPLQYAEDVNAAAAAELSRKLGLKRDEAVATGALVEDPDNPGHLISQAALTARENRKDREEGRRQASADRRYAADLAHQDRVATRGAAPDAYSEEDLALFPQSWRDVSEATKKREDYTTRGGQRQLAVDAAARSGRVLPDKSAIDEAQAGQRAVAQVSRIKDMLDAPADPSKPDGPKVGDFFGPIAGRTAALRSAGWIPGGKLPDAVIRARAALSKFSAKDRHELFGSALTKVESQFAVQFEPDLNAPIDTILSQLDAYQQGIENGLDATWGAGKSAGSTGSSNTSSLADSYLASLGGK